MRERERERDRARKWVVLNQFSRAGVFFAAFNRPALSILAALLTPESLHEIPAPIISKVSKAKVTAIVEDIIAIIP